ncbi:hypothetical protein AMS68_005420 [Peltaster fructicola]|uniref:Dynein light intermediate chain n=1 Tax=Peltaster fructicola TaxID=286661 RepID=A0A6H0XYR7_9PEZI|nr:hypothetical protein AMS68_005420 [Peltaster fructicola]
MAAITTRTTASRLDGVSKPKQNRTDIWTSLLKQTQVAQSRNKSNTIAKKDILVCGGSPEDQRHFLSSLTRRPPPQTVRRTRNDKVEQQEKGTLALSNRYAYGYGHCSLYSSHQVGGVGASALGAESEEVVRLQCHCIPAPEVTYEKVLRRILLRPEKTSEEEEEEDQDQDTPSRDAFKDRLSISILLSWNEPWKFLQQIRAWLQLLGRAINSDQELTYDDQVQLLLDHGVPITVVVQHVEAQQELEREGWTEETFDHVCQVLRTVLLPLHPLTALIYAPSISSSHSTSSALTEIQKVIFSSLNLDMFALTPRPTSSGGASQASKKEELLPRHNVVDRINIVIPRSWDSAGKVRLLSETFSPEDLITAWSNDMAKSVFPTSVIPAQTQPEHVVSSTEVSQRQNEEVFSVEPTSPVSTIPSLPPSPSKTAPSALRAYEARIVDPNAHKAARPVSITVVTRPEQEFLREMKVELDNYAGKDKEKGTPGSTASPVPPRMVGIPTGDSTGALDSLGDVSINFGGVSYNSSSAEAAIERLKRPHAPGVHDSASPTTNSSRAGTPRPPRRMESDREGTPDVTTPSNNKANYPAEDLEKYFASLVRQSGGVDSRQGTPSRK